MDWWLIPIGIGVVALLWLLWVAAFHPAERVSALPELDGYVPGRPEGDDAPRDTTEEELRAGEQRVVEAPTESNRTIDPGATDRVAGADAGDETDDDGGIWIELDITPLFPSSESQQIVDLSEAEDPEPTG